MNSKQQFFIVPDYIGSFYNIPINKGGTEVMNLNKKSLQLNDEKNTEIELIDDPLLKYSIQLFSSSNYFLVKEKLDLMTNQNNIYIQDLSLKTSDFFIAILNSDLGKEYMLLYKNFSTQKLASDYCLKNFNYFQKCLIVNAQYLN